MRSRTLPAALLAALALAASSHAQLEERHTAQVPLEPTDWAHELVFPRFDPARGILQSVAVALDGRLFGAARVENLGAVPSTVRIGFAAELEVRRDGGTVLALDVERHFRDPLAAYDGATDFAGPSGADHPAIEVTGDSRWSAGVGDDVDAFVGPAGAPGTVVLEVVARGVSAVQSLTPVAAEIDQAAAAEVELTYVYLPDCDGDGVADDAQLGADPGLDANGDGVLDACECATPNRRAPASLLVFPEVAARAPRQSVLTITNTSAAQAVDVELVFLDAETCLETNFTFALTPLDTLTLVAGALLPADAEGWAYAFAKRPGSGEAIAFDHLVGALLELDGLDGVGYSVAAVGFPGLGGGPGTPTDLDGDGRRDLDGREYGPAPDELLIPRFLGQEESAAPEGAPSGAARGAELVLVDLTGGGAFETVLDLLVYNDNEEVFSAQVAFRCWRRVPLLEVSALFARDFLADHTAQDPDEVLGLPGVESGWLRIDGREAHSSAASILDPAVYAVLIERVGVRAAADLPFERCAQTNGSLLPTGVLGDG